MLFLEFARLSLAGFGGVLPFARHSIVERNHWLNDQEFAELLGVGQILPGPNVVNLSLMLGWRFAGWQGALAAFSGLVLIPMGLLLVIAMLYSKISFHPAVQQAVGGMAAVAAGLVLATGLKLATRQPRTVRAALLGSAVFAMAGLLRWPLVPVVAVLIPLALLAEWHAHSTSHRD